MLVARIIAGPGFGQMIDAHCAAARTRLGLGTAELFDTELGRAVIPGRQGAETTALEPARERAVTAAQHPPKRKR
jgi:hypothetical protein